MCRVLILFPCLQHTMSTSTRLKGLANDILQDYRTLTRFIVEKIRFALKNNQTRYTRVTTLY